MDSVVIIVKKVNKQGDGNNKNFKLEDQRIKKQGIKGTAKKL